MCVFKCTHLIKCACVLLKHLSPNRLPTNIRAFLDVGKTGSESREGNGLEHVEMLNTLPWDVTSRCLTYSADSKQNGEVYFRSRTQLEGTTLVGLLNIQDRVADLSLNPMPNICTGQSPTYLK